jgi:hypothetical protein
MASRDQLSKAFDQVLHVGVEGLTPVERELFRIQAFIVSYEADGLSGYLYNHLPDLSELRSTVHALKRHQMDRVTDLLSEAVELFEGYVDLDPPTTWNAVLAKYDPNRRLDEIDQQIHAIERYGLE